MIAERIHPLTGQPRKTNGHARHDLFALREADCRSRNLVAELEKLAEVRERVNHELRERNSVHIADLAVDGKDVMRELGLRPGPDVGRVLDHLLERVLEDPQLNRSETLLEIARKDFGGAKKTEGE